MFEIFLYLLEGLMIGYYNYKFNNKKINYYTIIFITIIFTLTNLITKYYFIYNYLTIIITISLLYLINNTKNLFISTYIGIIIGTFDTIAIPSLIFKTNTTGVWYTNNYLYYLILIISKTIIFVIFYLTDKKELIKTLDIHNKYLNILTSLLLINCIITIYIANSIYMNNISYNYVYLLLIIFIVTIISVFLLISRINKDNLKAKQQELELMHYKSIEEKYLIIDKQNKRNEEIKHDLEYFLALVNKKQDQDKIANTLINTINKIEQNNIKIYSRNILLNNLLEEMKNIANTYNQKAFYNLNINDIDLSLSDYQNIINLYTKLCKNNQSNKIDININQKNNLIILEFIIKPITKKDYDINSIYIIKERINDFEVIKYILKID